MRKCISMLLVCLCAPLIAGAQCTATANDTRIAVASRYDGVGMFVPPAAPGSTFRDPDFGCPITRLSNGAATFGRAVNHEYSNMSPVSPGGEFVLLVTSDGFWFLTDTKGNQITQPFSQDTVTASGLHLWGGEPGGRWINGHAMFYKLAPNTLAIANVPTNTNECAPNCLLKARTVHTFSEYTDIDFGGGEGDLQGTGSIVLNAPTSDGGGDVFTFDAVTLTKSPVLHFPSTACFDEAHLTPTNQVVVGWGCDAGGHSGMELFNDSLVYVRQLTKSDQHATVLGYGGKEYLVTWDGAAQVCEQAGLLVIDINQGISSAPCLFDGNFQWGSSGHFGSAKDGSGWVSISLTDYSNNTTTHENSASYPLAPGWNLPTDPVNNAPGPPYGYWGCFDNSVLLYNVGTGKMYQVAHHRSRPSAENYGDLPFAAASRHAAYIIINSDYGQGEGTFEDAYLIDISSITGR